MPEDEAEPRQRQLDAATITHETTVSGLEPELGSVCVQSKILLRAGFAMGNLISRRRPGLPETFTKLTIPAIPAK